ncbi:uracil-DNA glycosylase [Aquamicrobium segne]|uniref:Type-5 uracil-DNA glycosylase n=1 Tax=Aquamicrobium segne TaxID=469547 RepID=A0ABW0GVM2_9HYPH
MNKASNLLQAPTDPDPDCPICPRLHDFIAQWRIQEPDWFNAPVPPFLPLDGRKTVRLLIVGLAPGLRGANRTGRPFTGDYAGDLLYSTLIRFHLARGRFEARPDDSLELIDTAIVNAVRCVPPQNKPTGPEITNCRAFLIPTIQSFPNLTAVLALGTIAHQSMVRTLGGKVSAHPFKHGGRYEIGGLTLFSSYHCSRYNTNTGVLTPEMFASVFRDIADFLNIRPEQVF